MAATIVGTINNDVINGTAGNDVIVAGDGNDTINGLGRQRPDLRRRPATTSSTAAPARLSCFGDPGRGPILGDADNDTLVGNAGGGDLNDVGDVLHGGTGNDFLDGWVGNDILDGGLGNDPSVASQDVDTVRYDSAPAGVNASLTANSATGGAGNDTYNVAGGPIENIVGSQLNDVLVGDSNTNVIRRPQRQRHARRPRRQ